MADYGTYISGLAAQLRGMPPLPVEAPPPDTSGNTWIGGGLSAGLRELRGLGGAGVQAIGKFTGLQGIEDWGAEAARNNFAAAQRVGRPDLEIAPWQEGGASTIPWLTYQAAKAVPTVLGMVAAGAALPEAAVPAGIARLGAALPGWLGGGSGLAADAANIAGRAWAKNVVGGTLANLLPSAGGLYRAEEDRAKETGEEPSAGRALALAPFTSAVGAVAPAQFAAFAKPVEQGGSRLAQVALHGASGAVAGVLQGGVTEGVNQTLRPDRPFADRMESVVQAALQGGAVGGVLGAGSGAIGALRQVKRENPTALTDDVLTNTVDTALAPPELLRLPAPETNVTPARLRVQDQSSGPVITLGDGIARLPGAPEPLRLAAPETNVTPPSLRVQDQSSGPVIAGAAPVTEPLLPGIADRVQVEPKEPFHPDVYGTAPRPFEDLTPRQLAQRLKILGQTETLEQTPDGQIRLRGLLEEQRIRKLLSTEQLPLPLEGGFIHDRTINPLPTPAEPVTRLPPVEPPRETLVPPPGVETVAMAQPEATPFDPTTLTKDLRPRSQRERTLIEMINAAQTPDEAQGALRTTLEAGGNQTLNITELGKRLGLFDEHGNETPLAREAPVTEARNAVQEPIAAGVDVRQPTENGRPVAGRDAEGNAVAGQGETERQAGIPIPQEVTNQENLTQGPAQAETPLPTKPAGEGPVVFAADKTGPWNAEARDTSTGDIPFRAEAAASPTQPLSNAAFAQALDNAKKLIPENAHDRVHVVGTAAELPPEVQVAAAAQGIPLDQVRGVLNKGETYIVQSNVKSPADLQETLLHEVLGHGGARALMGTGRGDAMAQLFDAAGGLDGVMRIAKKFGVESALREYIPEGPQTPEGKAYVFDELLAQAAGNATGKTSLALRTWAGELKRSLITFLEKRGMTALARRFDTISALDTAVLLKNMREAVSQGRDLSGGDTSFQRSTPAEANDKMKEFAATANGIMKTLSETVNPTDLSVKAGKIERAITTVWSQAQRYGHLFVPADAPPGTKSPIHQYADVMQQRGGDTHMNADLTMNALTPAMSAPRAVQDLLAGLMSAGGAQIDPTKTPEQHTHLLDATGKLSPERRTMILEANRNLQKLNQMQGGAYRGIYPALHAVNEWQFLNHLSTVLSDFVRKDPVAAAALPEIAAGHMDEFRDTPGARVNAATARDFFREKLMGDGSGATGDLAAVRAYLTNERNTALGDVSARDAIHTRISPLEAVLANTQKSIEAAKAVPYFHLGRMGDYFVSFDMAGLKDANGAVTQANPTARAAIEKAFLDNGFNNFEMNYANDKPAAYLRVDTPSQADALRNILVDLQKQGHVQPDSIQSGEREVRNSAFGVKKLIEDYTQHLNNSSEFRPEPGATAEQLATLEADKAASIARMRDFMLDQMPDSSVNKVMVRRSGTAGYSKDMLANFAQRAQIGGNALASMAATPKIMDIMQDIRSQVREAQRQTDGNLRSVTDIANMQGVLSELNRRTVAPQARLSNSVPDMLRAVNHAFYTAVSPAYAAVQLVSIPQFLLPELGKQYGYANSARAIAGVTTDAFKILKAAFTVGNQTSLLRASDGTINAEVLAKSGVSPKVAEFVRKAVNQGYIEVGSQGRELGQVADSTIGSLGTNAMRYSTAMGRYAETFSRLIAALAVQRLHPENSPVSAHDAASNAVRESLFTFSEYNNSKMLSKNGGVAGPLTPIMASFLSWQAQAVEKMYRELGTAFAGFPGGSAAASRKFLAGHLAAMTVLAGTMGLPFASVAARAADKLVDMFSEDGSAPFDVKASWRHFLADTFGKDIGEVLAHGVSRAAGVDLAGRIGEQDILPFSKFLTDRRKAQDIAEDLALRMEGSPVSAATNIFAGVNDIFNHGDVLQGMAKVLPAALRNQLNAYRMTTMGYTDANNNRLPMTPGARSILAQAIGFTPSEKAEYEESRLSQMTRRTDLDTTSALIRKHYATAKEQGDETGAQAALQEAVNFSRLNPAHQVASTLGSTLMQRARERAMAQATGAPMGVNPRDREAIWRAQSYNTGYGGGMPQ